DFLGTDIKFWMWGYGADLHRSDDMSNTSLSFDTYRSWGGESSGDEFRLSRAGSSPDTMDSIFSIYTGKAAHSLYLEEEKITRLSGNFRWITSDERLAPAKMTSFGGMYSVRGYDEYEHVADGGILATVQYELDLVKLEESQRSQEGEETREKAEKPFVRKLAPLVFCDYGRAKIRDPIGTEKEYEELISVGLGFLVELGDNFRGALYYGYPLQNTDSTRTGKGRISAGAMYQF
ncbi:MAG: ShlB/FhaC/HecB family hemolysin secretion/activation protein, partial [Planctomycetota bacterium]